jgi:hypothetical protein
MFLQPVDAADQRGFARTGRAANHDPLAAIDGHIHMSRSTWKLPYHLFIPVIWIATSSVTFMALVLIAVDPVV